MRRLSLRAALLAGLAGILLGGTANATSITLSDMSSDATPAGQLLATFDFSYNGGNNTLALTVTNDTVAPNEFNISEVYFNAAASVTGLTLLSATHSVEGDVTAGWLPVLTDIMVDGFDMFDFGMQDGTGENEPNLIGPTEDVVFVLSLTGTASGDADFIIPNLIGKTAAAKFVNGPDDPEAPGNEDSAFGATAQIPEPGTLALLLTGLLGLGLRRSCRR